MGCFRMHYAKAGGSCQKVSPRFDLQHLDTALLSLSNQSFELYHRTMLAGQWCFDHYNLISAHCSASLLPPAHAYARKMADFLVLL